MSYKIAVATSDGTHVDLAFGETDCFWIYEIEGAGNWRVAEKRQVLGQHSLGEQTLEPQIHTQPEAAGGCHGCSPGRAGCAGKAANLQKLPLVEDCRCVLCRQIGFQIRKQLERRTISVFDISYGIEEALGKITSYFDRMDRHQNLRQI